MHDTLHPGDLAEYRGTVRRLRGRRCEVVECLPYRYSVVFRLPENLYTLRRVAPANLKRVGGGCLKTGMRDEG